MITAMQTVVETTCTLEEDGNWRVDLLVKQRRKVDGGEWQEKEAAVKSYDRDRDHGLATVNVSMSAYLDSINFDMFEEKNDTKVRGKQN